MSEPIDKKLYTKVKNMASKKFKSPTGVYRSSWIVRKYKSLGGKYKSKTKSESKLKRWYKEKWIDLNRPIKHKNKIIGYESCGRKSLSSKYKYPLCRPSIKVSSKTPKTYHNLSKKIISKAKKEKSKYKYKKNVSFGKRKTSKRKTSKRKSVKRKTSKRKSVKRKTSKRKSVKRKTSKRKSVKRK